MKASVKSILNTFLLAVGAGLCIGVGGSVSLLQSNTLVGAIFFTVGLFTILIFGFNLYTGMVGYLGDRLLEKKPSYLGTVACVWLGNFAGTAIVASVLRLTRNGDRLRLAAQRVMEVKLNDTWYSLLILGVFCGMMMFLAVDTYKKRHKDFLLLACIAVILGVVVFILAGFEHSIADMFYAVLAGKTREAIVPILLITLGNAIGGNLIPMILRVTKTENQ
ncbi:MAG: formate/nitrite transporter family protein [Ruminococcaceae bacterium]|nr:formate/nitrite transporter family protein [Oscillospiraceae bacterium]